MAPFHVACCQRSLIKCVIVKVIVKVKVMVRCSLPTLSPFVLELNTPIMRKSNTKHVN